jgi:hypothetical protein
MELQELHHSPLKHPWLPLVSLAIHWLPLGSPVLWNTTGQLEYPWNHPWGTY